MAKAQRLFERIRNNPEDVRFSDICKMAESFGFTYKGGKGSHKVYIRKDIEEILNFQNVKGKAKPYQVRQFLKIIEEHELKLKEEQKCITR